MQNLQLVPVLGFVSTICALMTPAAGAEVTQVTGVQVNPTSTGITGTLIAANAATPKQEILSPIAKLTATQQHLPTPSRLSQRNTVRSAQLVVQKPVPTPADSKEVVQVTSVRLSTRDGLEVILETIDGQLLTASTRIEGNTLIADIPKAILALPTGKDFRADNPATGITNVTVTQFNASNIRVQVRGKTTVPTAKVVPSQSGLVLIFTSQADTTTVQTTPETPADERTDELELEAEEDEASEKPLFETPQSEQPIEVTVTATRTEEQTQDVPRSVTVINREQIEQQTGLSRDLGEILGKTVPGLAPPTQSASSFGQTLRGRNTLVLIDRVPQSSSRNAFRDLKTIDPAAIERIEVVRGPSAIYGDGATGGVINIITRTASQERLTSQTQIGVRAALGNLEADSFGNNIQHSISGTEDNLDFSISAALTNTGSFFDAQGDRIPSDPNAQGGFSDAETINLFAKFGVNLDEQQRLQLTFNRFDEHQDTDFTTDPTVNTQPGRQKSRTLEGLNLDDLPASKNTIFNLQYSHENLLGSQVQAQFYYRDYLTRFFPFDGRNFRNLGNQIYQSRVDSERFGGRLQIETPVFNQGAAKLLWGLDYFNEDTFQPVTTFDRSAFEASGGLDFRSTGERTWTPPIELSSLGLFAQLNWDISDRFIVNGGLRYENADVSVKDFTTLANPNTIIPGGKLDFDATLFNIGTVYFLTDQLNVFANFSQGFSLTDIGIVLRNVSPGFDVETLRPEPQKVDSYEIGLRGAWDSVQASVSAFYNQSELGTTFSAPNEIVRAL